MKPRPLEQQHPRPYLGSCPPVFCYSRQLEAIQAGGHEPSIKAQLVITALEKLQIRCSFTAMQLAARTPMEQQHLAVLAILFSRFLEERSMNTASQPQSFLDIAVSGSWIGVGVAGWVYWKMGPHIKPSREVGPICLKYGDVCHCMADGG